MSSSMQHHKKQYPYVHNNVERYSYSHTMHINGHDLEPFYYEEFNHCITIGSLGIHHMNRPSISIGWQAVVFGINSSSIVNRKEQNSARQSRALFPSTVFTVLYSRITKYTVALQINTSRCYWEYYMITHLLVGCNTRIINIVR